MSNKSQAVWFFVSSGGASKFTSRRVGTRRDVQFSGPKRNGAGLVATRGSRLVCSAATWLLFVSLHRTSWGPPQHQDGISGCGHD